MAAFLAALGSEQYQEGQFWSRVLGSWFRLDEEQVRQFAVLRKQGWPDQQAALRVCRNNRGVTFSW